MNAAPARTSISALLLALIAAASGCASITVYSREGTIRTRGLFGTRVQAYALSPLAIHTRGLGVFAAPRSLSLGLQSQIVLYAPRPDDCRVVLIAQSPEQTRRLLEVLDSGGVKPSDICTDTGELAQ
ncbi:hypothetical protein [Lysobacter sp. CA199]|uniref:hypothetical protein n=1 Tax=Lysobacter sp. CA199 TaxID=3455608 RepID=UPI003F8D2341